MAAECSSSCLFLVAFTFLPTFLRYVITIKLKMTLLIYLNYQFSQFKHMIWIRYRFVKFGNHWILFLFPNKPNSFTKIRKIKHKPTISVSITGSSCHSFSLPWQWFSKSAAGMEHNSFKIHSLICFSDDGFREHYLHRLSAKTWEFATTVIVFKPFSDIPRPLDGSTVILEEKTLMKAILWEPKCFDFYLNFSWLYYTCKNMFIF